MAINYPEAIRPGRHSYYEPQYWGDGYADEIYWHDGFIPKTSAQEQAENPRRYVEPSSPRDEVRSDSIGADRIGDRISAERVDPTVENTFGYTQMPAIANAMLGFSGGFMPGALVKGGLNLSNAWSLDKAREVLGLSKKGMVKGSFSASKGIVGTVTIGNQTYTVSAEPDPLDPNMISVEQALDIAETTGQPIQEATKEQVQAREAQMKALGTTPSKAPTSKGAMVGVARDAVAQVAGEVLGRTVEEPTPVEKAMPDIAPGYVPGYVEALAPAAPVTPVEQFGLMAPAAPSPVAPSPATPEEQVGLLDPVAAAQASVSPNVDVQDRISRAFSPVSQEVSAPMETSFFDTPSTTSTQVASLDPSAGITSAPTSQAEYTGGMLDPAALDDNTAFGYGSPLAGITDRVTSEFGPRGVVSTSRGVGSRNHKGIDMSRAPGARGYPASAAATGVVASVDPVGLGGLGKNVTIDHPDGRKTTYAHLDSVADLQVGQQIGRGVTVGTVGNTGNSEAPHLHFEVADQFGNRVNPRDVVDFTLDLPTPATRPEAINPTPSMVSPTSFFEGPMTPASFGEEQELDFSEVSGPTFGSPLGPSFDQDLGLDNTYSGSFFGGVDEGFGLGTSGFSSPETPSLDQSWGVDQGFGTSFGPVGGTIGPDTYGLGFDNTASQSYTDARDEQYADFGGLVGAADIGGMMDTSPSSTEGMDTVEKAEAAAAEQSDKANDTGQDDSEDGADSGADSGSGSGSDSGGWGGFGGFGDNDDNDSGFGGGSLF